MEISTNLQFTAAQVLYDVEKFYDHARWDVILATAEKVEYPLLVLALALQMHGAPRRVATADAVSDLIWPRRSLMAGCSQGTDLARLALWSVLEYVHAAYRPRELNTWVDDLAHQERGRKQDVVHKIVQVAEALVAGLQELGFKVAAKSTILAHPLAVGHDIVTAEGALSSYNGLEAAA